LLLEQGFGKLTLLGPFFAGNLCLKHGQKVPYMSPIEPGKLYQQISELFLPPLPPPSPILVVSNVTEAPLPSVSGRVPTA